MVPQQEQLFVPIESVATHIAHCQSTHQDVPENARRGSETVLLPLRPSVLGVAVDERATPVLDIDVSMLVVEWNERR